MRTKRRLLTCALALTTLLPAFAGAQSTDYPTRPVRVLVAYPPGGSTDIAARLVSEKLAQALGQPVVVENKPGAGGTIGGQQVANAEADGYTLLFGSAAELSVAPVTMKNVPFETLRHFQPITLVGRVPFLLLTSSSAPPKNLKEFIAWIESQKGSASYSSFGNNTTNHLGGEAFKAAAGIDVTHVPYRGSAQSLTDVVSGQVQYTLDTVTAALPQVQGGRLRAIAITTPERLAALPEVPTASESGLPGFTAGTWFGVLAPAGTPQPVVDKLNREIVKVLALPEIQQAFLERGIQPVGNSPAEFGDFIRAEIERWTALAKRIGLQPQ
jgi:tripartite-type tricarboxylate transporter receptor subunit TctC